MNKFEYKNLTPFKWFVLENFPFIEADFDALTEWQLFCKLGKEINKIINSTNTLGIQVESLTDYVKNYFDNLDVQEEINNKLNQMVKSGELQILIKEYFSEIEEKINNQDDKIKNQDDKIKNQDDKINNQNDKIQVLINRMDTFTKLSEGSTTGDAELIDIRNSFDGIIYPTAGASVRGQANELNNEVENLELEVIEDKFTTATEQIDIDFYNFVKYGAKIILEVTNTSNSPGYAGFSTLKDTIVKYNISNFLLNANTTKNFVIPLYAFELVNKIEIRNVNNLKSLRFKISLSFAEDTKNNSLFSNKINGTSTEKYSGYIGNDGQIHSTTSGTNRFIIYSNVKKGDVFKYSGKYGWNVVFGYKSDGTAIPLLSGGEYTNQLITITDESIKFVIGWSDESLKELTFKYIGMYEIYEEAKNNLQLPNLLVVAPTGSKFSTIQEAITYAKTEYDVLNENVTIFVKNGIYNVEPTNEYPYAPINKGANRISIIGESKEGVIINCTNTGTTQSKVMDIGGPCIIENLTINCLRDNSYTIDTDLRHNCYCIHNDSNYITNEKYTTTVKNCKLYSECHSPVGAGLRNNQTQIYENVETISNGILSAGSLYVHAPANAGDENCSVIINNCNCLSKDKTKALTLPDVDGTLSYRLIDTTVQRTIVASNGNKVIDDSFRLGHKMTALCALNNNENLNK